MFKSFHFYLALLAFGFEFSGVQAAPSMFFANQDIQGLAPKAFALQKEAVPFLLNLEAETKEEKEFLVLVINNHPELMKAIGRWQTLTMHEQIPYLRQVFKLETEALGITPPELVIQSGIINGPAYFEFDLTKPGPGKVILNPEALAKEKNQYASLALLLHETRHSAQIQHQGALREAYQAAFAAQKDLKGKLSFCDFLILNNEYEAFQFGNYVLGRLTDWKVDMPDMGTFASQYNSQGALKIDLPKLLLSVGSDALLEEFNHLEIAQKNILGIP